MRGVTLGEPIPEGLPAPAGAQINAPFAYTLWTYDDGLSVSVTADAEIAEVLYIEAWPQPSNGQPAPLDGLIYGETTRADLHARFGSEGIVFEDRGRFAELGPIAAYFITYEVAGSDTVVSFVTIQPLTEASEDTADASVLDSVIVANGPYLDQIWGVNRGRLAGYEQIENPFPSD